MTLLRGDQSTPKILLATFVTFPVQDMSSIIPGLLLESGIRLDMIWLAKLDELSTVH